MKWDVEKTLLLLFLLNNSEYWELGRIVIPVIFFEGERALVRWKEREKKVLNYAHKKLNNGERKKKLPHDPRLRGVCLG